MILDWPIVGPIVSMVVRWLGLPRPEPHLTVRCTGGSSGKVDFVATVSNAGMKPAMDCELVGEIEDVGVVYQAGPFNLGAGELDQPIRFSLERPRLAELVHANNSEVTLYGRELTVRLSCGRRKVVVAFAEPAHDPVTDAARYAVQQAAWAQGRGLASHEQ